MAKRKICVSFDYENDDHLRRTLYMWNANPYIDFSFDDTTPKEIQSSNYSVVKAVLTKKIEQADYLLVIIGKHANVKAHDSELIGDINWMNWEINKAKSLGKKLVAVKLDWTYDSPLAILRSQTSWARSFKLDLIKQAILYA